MTALMIQGTSSWAGKSLLTTALARLIAREGIAVAPFKAQNMSNNARVVEGGEIGVAQYLQALAARVVPDVRMNPVLVKPEGETSSQVVVDGKADLELSALDWRSRPPRLWAAIERAYRSLEAEFDVVLIEGAGSPAEINLQDTDLANMKVAELADADVLLVADMHRGGAFAHLYGTWALLEPRHRARIRGFVLNRFRGDAALIEPGPQLVEELTGVPTLGVVPWLAHRLPDEDGVDERAGSNGGKRVAIVRYPTASNLDEFKRLEEVASVSWASEPATLDGADLVVLPGSKHVAPDLDWLRRSGIADAVRARAAAGRLVLGICGGLQMLGDELGGDSRIERGGRGLALLPVSTEYRADKLVESLTVRLEGLPPVWSALEGCVVDGYEIRHGRADLDTRFVARGPVLGVTFHGLLESDDALERLFGATALSLDAALDELADDVGAALDLGRLLAAAAS